MLESTHGRMQHFVLDVEDELFTLRERFDYVLIGGDNLKRDARLVMLRVPPREAAFITLGVDARPRSMRSARTREHGNHLRNGRPDRQFFMSEALFMEAMPQYMVLTIEKNEKIY
jgi:hypothetical protein